MKRRLVSVFLGLVMILCVMPAVAHAEEVFQYTKVSGEDNDALFEEYVEHVFGIGGDLDASCSTGAAENLNEEERGIYNVLKAMIAEVADGSRTSTSFGVDEDYIPEDQETFDHVIYALLADCSYELYWYDKTEGLYFRWVNDTPTYQFSVASAYAGRGNFTTDASKTSAASRAAANARAITLQHAGKDDYQRLKAYATEILNLTSYNNDAVTRGYDYGDPWQLIYVFDNDPSTRVVCEGYSKAFRYLCELTDFRSAKVDCQLVTGRMQSNGKQLDHMWNVVAMGNGKNYLVDLTNCDTGTIGAPDKLFLVGGEGAVANYYKVNIDSRTCLYYIYDWETKNTFRQDQLELSSDRYTVSALEGGLVEETTDTKSVRPTEIQSVNVTAGGAEIIWEGNPDAEQYAVYCKEGNSASWKKKGTTKSLYYTVKSLKSGGTYSFYIKGLDKKGDAVAGTDSDVRSILYLSAPKLVSAKVISEGVQVSWKAVNGCAKYRVLVKESGKAWESGAETTGNTAVITGLKDRVQYYFTVVCVDAEGNDASTYDTKGKNAVYMSPVELQLSGETEEKNMLLFWDQNEQADGYQIQYSNSASFSKGNKTVTITGSGTTEGTLTKLKSGKTYYVRIRTYVKIGKNGYYSAWSRGVSKKI